MAFDFNQLLNDPGFQFGASILGNSGQPGVVGNALGNMQKINQMKAEAANQAATLEETKRYHTGELDNAKAGRVVQEQQFGRQNEIAQAQLAQQAQQQALRNAVLRPFLMQRGIDPRVLDAAAPGGQGAPQQQAAPGAPGAPQASGQAGAQPQSMQYNIPQGGQLNSPPIGTMPGENPNGMLNGAQFAPTTPAPQGQAAPAPIQNFNPQAPQDPAGPMNNGSYGQPGIQAPNRPMMRASGETMLPYILGQESGNRSNAPTSVNGAVGPGQMEPATFQRFAKPGERIDNPTDNRAVAKRYLDYLSVKANGDPAKVAAAYFSGEGNMGTGAQPFQRDVADGNGKHVSSYVRDVMARIGGAQGAATNPGTTPQMTPPQNGPNPALNDAQMAMMLGIAGVPGAEQAMQYAQMEKPENVPAGGWTRTPDGQMTFNPDPYREAGLRNEAGQLSVAQQRLGMEQRTQNYEQGTPGAQGAGGAANLPPKVMNAVNQNRFETANADIQKSYDSLKELPTQYAALSRAQADLQQMIKNKGAFTPVGTAGDWKKTVIKAFTNTFGTAPSKDVVDAEDFDSAMAQLWMKAVKQVDQNPTAKQQAAIQQSFGTRSNDPAALNQILEATKESFVRQAQRHNGMVSQFEQVAGPDPYSRYLDLPQAQQQAASQRGTSGPKAGTVEGGFVFLGGNPADKASWAPAPKRGAR